MLREGFFKTGEQSKGKAFVRPPLCFLRSFFMRKRDDLLERGPEWVKIIPVKRQARAFDANNIIPTSKEP